MKTAGLGQVARPVNRSGLQAEQLKLEQQHDQVDWGQQGVIRPGSSEAWILGSGPPRVREKQRKKEIKKDRKKERKKEREREREKDKERERELARAYLNSHRTLDKTGEILQI